MLQDVDSEEATLSVFLLGDSKMRDRISRIVSADDFFEEPLSDFFSACKKVHDDTPDFDYLLVRQQLIDESRWDATLFAKVLAMTCSAASGPYYAKTVRKLSDKRKMIAANENVKVLLEKGDHAKVAQDLRELADLAAASFAVDDEKVQGGELLVDGFVTEFTRKCCSSEDLEYATEFTALNEVLNGGFNPGELVICGARPGDGKTTLGLNLARMFCQNSKSVLFVSLEMGRYPLICRLISMVSNVRHTLIQRGNTSLSDSDKVNAAANEMKSWPLELAYDPSMNYHQLEGMMATRNPDIVIVDYLTLLETPGADKLNRYERVGLISRSLKRIALKKNIPVIAMCQLKRDVDTGSKERQPTLGDLRESGNIEQDADVVMMLRVQRENRHELECPIDVFIEKNRNGASGVVKLVHHKEYGLFKPAYTGPPPSNFGAYGSGVEGF